MHSAGQIGNEKRLERSPPVAMVGEKGRELTVAVQGLAAARRPVGLARRGLEIVFWLIVKAGRA